MKSIKNIAVVALLALSSASLASAATYTDASLHVTGSTAFRVADVSAEAAYLAQTYGGTGNVYGVFYSGTTSASSMNGANDSVLYTSTDGVAFTARFVNHFNGSIGGVEALACNVPQYYVSPTPPTGVTPALVTGINSHTAGVGGGYTTTILTAYSPITSTNPAGNDGGNSSLDNTTLHGSDIAFSDVSLSTAEQIINTSSVPSYTVTSSPTSIPVGICPFVFVCGAGTSSTDTEFNNITNMTPQLASYLWTSGVIPMSFFTGNTADRSKYVYATGRDVDSGTRATLLAETGYKLGGSGIVSNGVIQYFPYDSTADANNNDPIVGVAGNAPTAISSINALAAVPEETLDGVDMSPGDGGYYAGGNLATAMKTPNNTGVALVTALGMSDAQKCVGVNGCHVMSYCGVTFNPSSTFSATNEALIAEGAYTFWSYENELYYPSTSVTAAATGIASQLNSGIDAVSAVGVTTSTGFHCKRNGDGANVTDNAIYIAPY